jgi:Ca2+-binding EF-hand superfamily protein
MNWNPQLTKFLLKILDGEKRIEFQRQNLGRIPLFEPYAAFLRIDRRNKKYIDIQDLRNFLIENKIRYSASNLSELIKLYDKDRDSVLNYQEFLKIILTNNDPDLRSRVTQRETYNVDAEDYLNNQIESELAKLLALEMDLTDELKIKAEAIRYIYGFSVTNAFQTIDYLNYNYLEEEELAAYLKKNGAYISQNDITQLISRLDKDCDGKVSFNDFSSFFFAERTGGVLSSSKQKEETNLNRSNLFNSYSSMRNYGQDNYNSNRSLSPLARSNLNLKASMNSYTSPLRSIRPVSPLGDHYSHCISPINSNNRYQAESSLIYSQKPFGDSKMNFNHSMYNNDINKSEECKNINSSSVLKYTSKSNGFDYNSIIIKLFTQFVELDAKSESVKEQLALRTDIQIRDLFTIFDIFSVGNISIAEFKEGLSSLDIFATTEEIKLLFSRYDLGKDGKLNYSEFSEMILPNKIEYAGLLRNRVLFNKYEKEVSNESRKIFLNLLRLLITNETKAESLRKFCSDRPLFSVYDAFDNIRSKIKNYLIKEDVKYILFIMCRSNSF